MEADDHVLYPLFKMVIGIICLVLSCEYLYTYCVYGAVSFGIIYIGDTLARAPVLHNLGEGGIIGIVQGYD